jgi:hypothetical protein
MGSFGERPRIKAMILLWFGAGKPFDMFVAGAATIHGATAGETDKITDAARVSDYSFLVNCIRGPGS